MDKFQMLFPFSSSTDNLSSRIMINSNNNAFHHHHNVNFQGAAAPPNGFLELMKAQHQIHNNNQVLVREEANKDVASSEVNEVNINSIEGNKKKGSEKKMKKAKYAFQTRSRVDILDDGYRWRKYGQKAVKNNKFPRSYYRCTYQGCNVKKQVQRLTTDESIVITTYEGMHNHSIEKQIDNFEHILSQMQIYNPYSSNP